MFRTEEMESIYDEQWSARPIHPMRGIRFNEFESEILSIFIFQRLVHVMKRDYPLYREPTLLFYLHLEKMDEPDVKGIKTFLYGEELVFTKDDIFEICGGHKVGYAPCRNDRFHRFLASIEPQYRRNEVEISMLLCGNHTPINRITSVNQLCPRAKMIEKFVRHNLLPEHGHKTSLTGATKIMIYCLLARVPIAFPQLLFQNMLDVKNISGLAVPYGQLITRLLIKRGIAVDHLEKYPGLKLPYDRLAFQDDSDDEPQEIGVAPPMSAGDWEEMRMGIASIQRTLEAHSRVLEEHGRVMERHGHTIERQEEIKTGIASIQNTLDAQGRVLEAHGRVMERHGKIIERQEEIRLGIAEIQSTLEAQGRVLEAHGRVMERFGQEPLE